MFDLNDVAIFVRVARDGSFVAAGRRLGIPSNTISRRVQELEALLKTRLLHRSTRKLSLTVAGRRFFEQCAIGIDDIEQAHQDLFDASQVPNGTVRATAPADFFDHFPMEWVAEFMERNPRVQLEFLLSDTKVDLIGEGIDVAFRAAQMDDSSLVARKLMDNYLGLIASPNYLAVHGTPRTLQDLTSHECLSPPSQPNGTLWGFDGPDGVEEIRVTGRLYVNTAQGLLRAVRTGMGIALVPLTLVEQDLRDGHLVSVLPKYRRNVGGVYAVYPNRRQLSLAVSALIEFVVAKLEDRHE
ncbi:MAG: LysR family transcriptional regulator [Burkholderiales bacterium]|nr:LysR family transcriptional regulator [Burkholderiales bacterium]